MSLAYDLELQINALHCKRDSYFRLAAAAECFQLGSRFMAQVVELDAEIKHLQRALAATPARRYSKRLVETFEDDLTRVRRRVPRVPTTKYRAVG